MSTVTVFACGCPFTVEPDTLYKVTAFIRSNVGDGIGTGLGDEGTDPVDIIQLQMETSGGEIAQLHFTGRGANGAMKNASSPMLPVNTGGEPQPYTGFFYTHNTTDSTTADDDRLKFFVEFKNDKVYGPGANPAEQAATGKDPFSVTGFRVEKMVKPIFVVTPTPTPVPTPSAESGKLRFYAVKECGIYLGNKERLAEFLLDPVNDTLEYDVTWEHYEAGDTMELRGYTTQCTTNYGSLLYTLPGVSGSWSYSTSLDEGKLVIGSEYETGQVHLAITHGSVTTRAWLELDRDDDGLTDQEERYFSSSRTDRDSDEDGLMDGEEAHGWGRLGAYLDITTHPAEWDTDGDGLSDGLELGMQFEDRITSFTKNVTPIGSTLMDGTDFDDNDPVDALDDVEGWRFEDVDPSTTTNPARRDTDLDGFWDGGDTEVSIIGLGSVYRMGEDINRDGAIDFNGANDIQGSEDEYGDAIAEDDEYDPNHSGSYPPYAAQQGGARQPPTPRGVAGTIYLFILSGENTDVPYHKFRTPPPDPPIIDANGDRWYHDPSNTDDNQNGSTAWYKDGLWLMGYKIFKEWNNPVVFTPPSGVSLVVYFISDDLVYGDYEPIFHPSTFPAYPGEGPLFDLIRTRIIDLHHATDNSPVYLAFLGHSHGGGGIANLIPRLTSRFIPGGGTIEGLDVFPPRPGGGPNFETIFTGYMDAVSQVIFWATPERRYPGYDVAGMHPLIYDIQHPFIDSEFHLNYFQTNSSTGNAIPTFRGDHVEGSHVCVDVNGINSNMFNSNDHSISLKPYGHSTFLASTTLQDFVKESFLHWCKYYFEGAPLYDPITGASNIPFLNSGHASPKIYHDPPEFR